MSSSQDAPTVVLLSEGALASMGATLISNPFEVAKTRLQLQGQLQKQGAYIKKYNGMLHCMAKVLAEEGPVALQKGLVASLGHQITQNGVRFGLFQPAQNITASWLGHTYTQAKPPLFVNVVAGAGVGVIGCVFGSPFFMVKTRLQAQNKASMAGVNVAAAVGHQHTYTGTVDAFKKIVAEEGMKGLFHGLTIAIQRSVVFSAAQLAAYEWTKSNLTQYTGLPEKDMRVHALSSVAASAAVVATVNPLEVVMVRTYAKGGSGGAESLSSALAKIVKTEGAQGLYKGSVPLFYRLTPHFIATFIFLEQIRSWRIAYYANR